MKLACTAILALSLCAGLAQAQTNVPSQNAVGYVKIDVPAGAFVLAAMPFYEIGGEDMTIGEVMGSQLTPGSNPGSSDSLYKWDPTVPGYAIYFRNSGIDKWVNATNVSVETQDTLVPGEGYWLRSIQGSNQTVFLMGEVPDGQSAPTTTVAILEGFQFTSYPYPTEMAINSLGLTNGLAGSNPGSADAIYTWDPVSGYSIFFLGADRTWRASTNPLVATTASLQPGQGVWYRSRTNAVINWESGSPTNIPD